MKKFEELIPTLEQKLKTYEILHLYNLSELFRNIKFDERHLFLLGNEDNNETFIHADANFLLNQHNVQLRLYIRLFSMPLLFGGRYETRCEISFIYQNQIYVVYGLHSDLHLDKCYGSCIVNRKVIDKYKTDTIFQAKPYPGYNNTDSYLVNFDMDESTNIIMEVINGTKELFQDDSSIIRFGERSIY